MTNAKKMEMGQRIDFSKILQFGLVDQVYGSAIGHTDLAEIIARELPDWLTGDNVQEAFKDNTQFQTFLTLLDAFKAQCDSMWKYDEERWNKNNDLFYMVMGQHIQMSDCWDLNVWFMIRTMQTATRRAVKEYKRFISQGDNAENSNYMTCLDDLMKISKTADTLYGMANEAFNVYYDECDAKAAAAKAEAPTTQSDLDDCF